MEALLKFDNVTFYYQTKEKEIQALDNVNFDVILKSLLL